ncbi:MAG: hypothetical protein EU532_01660 [Promethearchaeota archaeon]|nr:MAG: hypothetical protein EU532_01660 [Candidatus Lokiarchaeota archaeon]
MQKVKINKISEQIQIYIEKLTFNGLNLVSQETIKQIEFLLQNASQVEAYRLATSLRYLHIELKRFLTQSPAFNIDRYVFFLSNCWLLTRGYNYRKDNKDDVFYQKLMGEGPQFELVKKLKLRLIGIEKIFLEGTIFGVVLYFLSLFEKTKNKILKWNVLQPPRGVINPEILLDLEILKNKIAYKELFYKNFVASNFLYSEKEDLIMIKKEDEPKIDLEEEEDFPLDMLYQFDFTINNLYNKCKKYEYTPFDLPTSFLNYILVKNVNVLDFYTEGEEESINTSSVYVFKLKHERGYPIYIRLQDKHINQVLIEKFKIYKDKKILIENLFGKLILERGKISVFPLCIINDNKEDFICISEIHQNYREIMKTLYKK